MNSVHKLKHHLSKFLERNFPIAIDVYFLDELLPILFINVILMRSAQYSLQFFQLYISVFIRVKLKKGGLNFFFFDGLFFVHSRQYELCIVDLAITIDIDKSHYMIDLINGLLFR